MAEPGSGVLVSVTFTVFDVTLKVPFHPAAIAEGTMASILRLFNCSKYSRRSFSPKAFWFRKARVV